MSALAVTDLVVRYGDVVAVDRVSFSVAEGEFVSLLGPSGCGKTTTLRAIAGLERASAGEIRIGSEVVAQGGREVPPERRGVNMVFQSYAVWPHMSVFDNVAYGLRVQRLARAEIARRTEAALLLVGLDGFGQRFGTELSGGQQQRVAVARAVVTEPRLLLFDEPLSNLDAGLRERMRAELVQLQRRIGRTSIYVTHDQGEAMAMSDRIILMHRGRIVQESSPRELYERPASRFAAGFIGSANLLDAAIVAHDGAGGVVLRAGGLTLHGRGAAPGAHGLACIRPENIVRVSDQSGVNVFSAQVGATTYLGTTLQCELTIADRVLRADLPARMRLEPGDAISVRIDPDHVILVPEDDAMEATP